MNRVFRNLIRQARRSVGRIPFAGGSREYRDHSTVISSSVYEQVKGKVDCGFTDLGPQQVRNIPEPVNTYAVTLNGMAATKPSKRHNTKMATITAVVAAAIAVGGYLTLSRPTDVVADLPAVVQAPSAGSLIVLLFQDYSEDKSLDYFADGLTEDLITDLARWKEFRIIARNTSMTYRDKPVDAREIAKETDTRYVLEGSVRRIADEMRITAQLINGENGSHVWAERFEDASCWTSLWAMAARTANRSLGKRDATIEAATSIVKSYPFDAEGLAISAASLTAVGPMTWLSNY